MFNQFSLENLLINETPLYIKNFVDHPERLISWSDVAACMNNPIAYNVELIDTNGCKVNLSKYDYAANKQSLFDGLSNGHGLIINEYGFYNEATNAFLNLFETSFDVNCAIHVYCGLQGSKSFNIHCDSPHNFILQVEGRTRWKVYANRMNTLLDFHAGYPTFKMDESKLTTAIDVVLEPGDGLYIPPKVYHVAYPDQARISISVPCWPRSKQQAPAVDRRYLQFSLLADAQRQ